MAADASRNEKLRYRIDTFLAQGNKALFLSLLAAFFVSLAAVSLLRFGVLAVEAAMGTSESFSVVREGLYGVWVTWL